MNTEPTKQHAEKAKALKKLIKQWLTAQDTKDKANVLLSRNPHLKKTGKVGKA
ncbi:hypothetical protein [Puia dinghuensis]|uniref:Uncharacterized protein n=1 Tax=Puia dinghuensis TaxID=1792502 RepID=A0A8J2UFP2_9BACT|nr:hypothetical protein [Puia dinghuensis]GGB09032.1 hypothetical protein GCM10011511_35710 [Puia dinghuensis]